MDHIFVDDSNPNVVYSGPYWSIWSGTELYNHTEHETIVSASMVYAFKGTSISAYGTIVVPATGTIDISSSPPSGTWSLDGGAPTAFQLEAPNQTMYRQLYFQTPDLPDDGDHTLTVVFNTQSWFDYLMVSPSMQSQLYHGYKLVKVDDTSSSIKYTGSWIEGGTSFEYNKTIHIANSSTSQATFSFYGTAITVFGTLPNTTISPNQPSTSFILDNGTPVAFKALVTPIQVHTIYQVPIFQATNLALDNHQLQIQAHDDSANLWLDFFMYEQWNSVTSSSVTSSSVTSSSPTTSATVHLSYNRNAGSIVGGSIGGVICALLAVGLLIWVLRCRRRPLPMSYPIYPESGNLISQTAAPSLASIPIPGPSITQQSSISMFQPIRKPPLCPSQIQIGDSATDASSSQTGSTQPPPYYTIFDTLYIL